jgi:hypothetical protein
VYVSEIFPTHIRSKGMALSISGYFLSLLIYLEASPTAFANIQWKYVLPTPLLIKWVLIRNHRFYLVFLIALTFFIVPTFFYYPETKNIPLEENNRLFG